MKRGILIGVLVIVLVGAILAVLVPAYKSIPVEKQAGAYLYFMATRHKPAVEAAVKERGTLSGIVPQTKLYREQQDKFGTVVVTVHINGMISAVNSRYKLNVTLVPTLKEDGLEWQCNFQPRQYSPPNCRTIMIQSTPGDRAI